MCETDQRALPQLALAAIENRDLGESQLRQLIAELLQRNILADLESRLSWVATVIKSGPLLGLFGTVLGMMAAFGRIGSGQRVDQKQIAYDISIALICTAMGLMTAIPFTYMLANLNIRVRTLQDSLSSGMTRFLEYFKDAAVRLPGPGK
jgi:biopolymer transport protein ExbB